MANGHRRRLIERAINNGLDTFYKHEVLELMLFFSRPRVDTNPIAHALIDKFGSIYNACNAPISELEKIEGIGKTTAEFLKILPGFARAYERSAYKDKLNFKNIEQIGEYCVSIQLGRVFETIFVLCFNTKNDLIKTVKIAEGTPGDVYIEPRKIIEQITHTSTVNVILCHNHPGGTLFPSQKDFEATSNIRNALDTINVKLVDHIIIANGDYISFKKENLIF